MTSNQDNSYMPLTHCLSVSVFLVLLFGLTAPTWSDVEVDSDIDIEGVEVNAEETSDVVKEDLYTAESLKGLSADELKNLILNIEQYSADDQTRIRSEYSRRLRHNDRPVDPSTIDSSFGKLQNNADEEEAEELPVLVETPVSPPIRTPQVDSEEQTELIDPRENRKPKPGITKPIPAYIPTEKGN